MREKPQQEEPARRESPEDNSEQSWNSKHSEDLQLKDAYADALNDIYLDSMPKSMRKQDSMLNDLETILSRAKICIRKLQECIEADKELMKKGRPALEKMKALPYIEKILYKKNYANAFLNLKGLKYLQEFIRKNSDDTYPCINQVNRILDLLDSLPIEKRHLDECSLGKLVLEIQKTMKGNQDLQRKSKMLLDKWFRIVADINISYSDIDHENHVYSRIFSNKKRKRPEDSRIPQSVIPKKALFDFTVKPVPAKVSFKNDDKFANKNYFKDHVKRTDPKSSKKLANQVFEI